MDIPQTRAVILLWGGREGVSFSVFFFGIDWIRFFLFLAEGGKHCFVVVLFNKVAVALPSLS